MSLKDLEKIYKEFVDKMDIIVDSNESEKKS